MSWTSPQCSESTVDSVNSLPLEGSRRYKWPSTNTQERLLHWGRGWTAWYSDFRVTQRRCNSKKEVGWHGLPSANQFHQNGCVVTWTEKAFFTNNKTAFFPAQEFPQRNSPPLAPFEIVLRQHPGAWGKYFQPPSALLPPRHPNTLPFANTLYLALLISSNYCGFIQISSSLILPLSPLTLPSACGYNHLNIAFGSGFDHRHWVVFYCCAFRNHRGRWRGLSIGRETHVVRSLLLSSQLKREASGTRKCRGPDHGLFPFSETDFSPLSLHISGLPLMDITRKSPVFGKLGAAASLPG